MERSAIGLGPGDVVQDSYKILRLLGQGGMGATFQGQNLATGHLVAIKVISPAFAQHGRAVDLFRRESALLRTVQSDAVIGYETTLQDRQGRLYLIMEFVEGRPLSHYVEKGARLSSDDALKLAARLGDGLAAIHRLGIVHRDISPDNILVPDDDILGAKIIDFGLASDTFGTEGSIIGDSFAGKINYASPEQLGLFGGKVGPKTDIYCLGLVLIKVVGAAVPGAGQGIAGAIAQRSSDIVLADPRLSERLRGVLALMLKADPAGRAGDLREVLRKDDAELREVLVGPGPAGRAGTKDGGRGVAQSKLPPARDVGKTTPVRKTPVAAIAIAAIAGVAVLAGGVFAWRSGMAPGGGGAISREVTEAKAVIASDHPLAEARALIAEGGADNLNAALRALMAMAGDEGRPASTRIAANLAIAAMYDPATFSPDTSPFREPNPSAARRSYQRAADLGSDEARAALDRLKE